MDDLRYPPTKWARSIAKRTRPFDRWRWMRELRSRNRDGSEPVVAPGGPVVSLTTFEPRWARVFYAIECIGAGRLKPSRLLLWVAPSVLELGMPPQLQRLVTRGLEIRTCEDLGSHKKYYPTVQLVEPATHLVTADDDVLYPLGWLQALAQAGDRHPNMVHAHRARRIRFRSDGTVAPYAEWPSCRSEVPSPLNVAIGIGGILYPPGMQQAIKRAGDGFRRCAPRADDLWLKAVALRNGFDVRQLRAEEPFLIELPGARKSGLSRHNVAGGGNDAQFQATFTPEDVGRLRRSWENAP